MIAPLDALLKRPPYGFRQSDKESFLLPLLRDLTQHHRENCEAYRRITDLTAPNGADAQNLAALPYLPVSLFKHRRLRSVPLQDVRTTIKSSGTTGAQVSQIDLDRDNARQASSALNHIIGSITCGQRLPILIVDCPAALNNESGINARASAILGMMPYGRDPCFALNDDFSFAADRVKIFLEKYARSRILVFGFTFIIWQYFVPMCEQMSINLANGILLHSGGWKKMQESAVDNLTFKTRLKQVTHVNKVMNFYGMAELPGTIFLENDDGLLYPPSYADVIIRDPVTFAPLPDGETGLVQILSILPRSYPGHSLLTEDLGVIETIDSGIDGRFGKGFKVIGRAPRAELRGCSDVLATMKEQAA